MPDRPHAFDIRLEDGQTIYSRGKEAAAPSAEALFASLLLFRVIYYVGPFVLALALLGANESIRRWNSLRAAMRTPDTE